jgi:hypothetical protein
MSKATRIIALSGHSAHWITRKLAYGAVLAIMAAVLANFAAAGASASTAARHHGIRVVVLGKWKHYSHKHKGTAGKAPEHCLEGYVSEIDSSRYVFIWDRKTWFRDGPGGTVSGTVTKASQIAASISVGASISINDLITDSQVTVSASVTKTVSTSVGNGYSHGIPARKFGDIEYGAWGYQVKWSYWRRNANCTATELDHGTGMVPIVATGWHYWTE